MHGPGGQTFGLFAIGYAIVVVAFAALIIVVLILLIRYLLAATRAARVYVETQRATPTGIEPPPATKPAVRTRKPPAT